MKEERKKLEKIYQALNEEEDTVSKKWNQALIPKDIYIIPINSFCFNFSENKYR